MENKFQKMLEQASDLAEDQEYEEAILLYDKILDSDQKYIPALLDKAATLQRMGKNSQSFQIYNSQKVFLITYLIYINQLIFIYKVYNHLC